MPTARRPLSTMHRARLRHRLRRCTSSRPRRLPTPRHHPDAHARRSRMAFLGTALATEIATCAAASLIRISRPVLGALMPRCHTRIQVEVCNFDNGDCVIAGSPPPTPTSSCECPTHWLGDNVCDDPLYNCAEAVCNFDGGECAASNRALRARELTVCPACTVACRRRPYRPSGRRSHTCRPGGAVALHRGWAMAFATRGRRTTTMASAATSPPATTT